MQGVGLCLACDKYRCLYCDKQAIYKENEETVVLAVESNLYACGSPIFPDRHPLSELIRVRTSIAQHEKVKGWNKKKISRSITILLQFICISFVLPFPYS